VSPDGESAEPQRIVRPFTTETACLLQPPREPDAGRPPLLVALHGQSQSGERQRGWLLPGLPPHFAAAFPDGFHRHEVRQPGRPIRVGHAWYLYTGDQQAFANSLAESEQALWPLIDDAIEALGADPQRLYLCGFSQGAYLAHCVAVRTPQRVAGWIAQCGRLKTEFLKARLAAVAGKPVLLQHGRDDEALPPRASEDSAAALVEHGARVTLRLYAGGHEITREMVTDLGAWLADMTVDDGQPGSRLSLYAAALLAALLVVAILRSCT
jgi:phospholipase/carboxylesterase